MGSTGVLDELPILAFLPADVRALVVRSFAPVSFPFGSTIVEEGSPADALVVIASGRARVLKGGLDGSTVPMNVLLPGDSLGHMELLRAAPHPFTVRASSDVLALRLDRGVFDALVESHPDLRTYLEAQVRHQTLHRFFPDFPPFDQLSPHGVLAVVGAELDTVTADAGVLLFRQGDPPGPLFLVEDGSLRLVRESAAGRPAFVTLAGAGEFFGDASALRGTPRGFTAEALCQCRLRTLSAEHVQALAAAIPGLGARLEERVSQAEYLTRASVSEDLTREILPADAGAPPAVAPGQVDREAPPIEEAADAPFAEGGLFVKRRRGVRVPFIRQIDEMDCGAACLAMVARQFGRRVSLSRVRQLSHTGLDGTSLRALCAAAEELGLAARSVKASPGHLDSMPLPAIVHWDHNHWLVLTRVGRRHVRVADPAIGHRRLARDEFERRWSGYAALFDYTAAFDRTPEAGRSLAWVWPHVRPHGRLLAQAVGLAVLVSALQMILPVFTQVVVDRVLVDRDLPLLNVLIGAMAGAMLFIAVAVVVQRYLLSFAAVRIDASTLDFITQRLLALPMGYFAARRTGDLQRRLDGVRHVRSFLVQQGTGGVTAVAQLVATVMLMAVYSPLLTAVFLATAPLYALLMVLASRWLRPVFQVLEDAYGRYYSYQIDAIKGIETVKALGGEVTFRERMLDQFQGLAQKLFRADLTMMIYEGAIDTVIFLGLGLFLWVGAHQVLQGQLTIGGLVAFNTLVALSTAPLRQLLSIWDNLQHARVLIDRLDDVMQHEPEQGHDRARLRPLASMAGRVTFRHVSFRYGGSEAAPILEHISADIAAGQTVAIVGRSGSGKSTLARCLAGLVEPTDGTILFDGLDLRTLNYRHLRRHIGYVLQDTYMFDDTIARNIAFGHDEPDPDRVRWAAHVASAAEFIERLPFGYDTRIGETGLALSGGQKQRIAIARAVYRRPAVLILDEATSALDAEAEHAVQQNIDTHLRGRTTFIIAHRLSTVRHAGLILVLERGRLVEQGTHDDLMRRQGIYYYLASQQLGLVG